ncbi:MAG: flagellar basal body L-ring protein FlgH [Alphaproteobacteria bacterium]|nr:flagellar basal body L-ring protein FlgH [Alphaproteobacteria bacterium]
MSHPLFSSIVRFPVLVLRRWTTRAIAVMLVLLVAGCVDRLTKVGETPELSAIDDNITERDDYPGTIQMPMPDTLPETFNANSLWRPGSRAFFKDLRATRVGDIVTVVIEVADSASLSNETSRSRNNDEGLSISALGGLEDTVTRVLPGQPDLGNLYGIESDSSNAGAGSIERNENIRMRVAAIVTQSLGNGSMVIYGRQELRVNYEVRELHVAGIIRPQDIDSGNAIAFDKIAEARVAYGGRGQINDVQQPRYGSQVADILLPF